MKKILEELQKILEAIKSPSLECFNPPIENVNELTNFLHSNYGEQIIIPLDLIEVYKWHNGTDYINAKDGIIKRGYFSDELCLDIFSEIKLELEADSVYEFKTKKLFPFCNSFNGELLTVPLDGSTKLIYCSTSDYEIDSQISMYDSLEVFFLTVIEFYKNNCLIINDSGVTHLDITMYDTYMQIGEKMNPTSDYWRVKREFQEQS